MVSIIYLRVTVTAGDCGSTAKLEGGDMSDGKKMIGEKPEHKTRAGVFIKRSIAAFGLPVLVL